MLERIQRLTRLYKALNILFEGRGRPEKDPDRPGKRRAR